MGPIPRSKTLAELAPTTPDALYRPPKCALSAYSQFHTSLSKQLVGSHQKCIGVNDQYLLEPSLLVAPVVVQNATKGEVYFPAGADWQSLLRPECGCGEGGEQADGSGTARHHPGLLAQGERRSDH